LFTIGRLFVYLLIGIKIFIFFVFSIGICSRFDFNWFVVFQLVSIYTSLPHFFWYHIWFNPLLVLCFEQKGGEKFIVFAFIFNPFWWLTKRGRRIWVLYAYLCLHIVYIWWKEALFICMSMHVLCACFMFHFNWYQGHVYMCFKNIHCILRTFIAYLICFIVMHELRGSFFEALL